MTEILHLLPVRQAVATASTSDGRCDGHDCVGNDAYYTQSDGGGSGGLRRVSLADAGTDAALNDALEMDTSFEGRRGLRHDWVLNSMTDAARQSRLTASPLVCRQSPRWAVRVRGEMGGSINFEEAPFP
jgi:hypothetical protein